MRADAGAELLQLVVVERLAGLERVLLNAVDGHLGRGRLLGVGRVRFVGRVADEGVQSAAGNATLDLETFFLENASEVLGGFEFLKSELAETEDTVHHDLRLFLHGVDLAGKVGLHGGFFFRSGFRLSERRSGAQHHKEKGLSHRC